MHAYMRACVGCTLYAVCYPGIIINSPDLWGVAEASLDEAGVFRCNKLRVSASYSGPVRVVVVCGWSLYTF